MAVPTKRVLVIGCGPAGLAAAHAAIGLHSEVVIIAPKMKTPQRGPLLLQRPLPGITVDHPDGYIRQIVIGGSILDYRLKLYGDVNVNINGDVLAHGYHAWKMAEAYNKMWMLYRDLITDNWVLPEDIDRLADEYDLVVSTAPASSMCVKPAWHTFISKTVVVTPGTSYFPKVRQLTTRQATRGTGSEDYQQPENTIIFNAGPEYKWARSSSVFGNAVTEWPLDWANSWQADDPDLAAVKIHKPISTDCNCHPQVMRTGRFGAWRNETWVDTAYYDVRQALISMRHRGEWGVVT